MATSISLKNKILSTFSNQCHCTNKKITGPHNKLCTFLMLYVEYVL